MKNYIAGCSGGIGQAVAHAFKQENIPFTGMCRSMKTVSKKGGKYQSLDVQNSYDVRSSIEKESTVYYCANAPYHQWNERLPAMLDGLLAGTKGKNIHLVYVDNYYAYGNQNNELHEQSEYAATTKKGKLRARLARQLQQYSYEHLERVSIVRAGDIYGPHVSNAIFGKRSIEQIIQGKNVDFPVGIAHPHCFNYVHDVGKALKLVGESSNQPSLFNVWHMPHAETISPTDLVSTGACTVGTHSKAIRIPNAVHVLLSLFIPVLREFKEMEYEFSKPMHVNAEKFRKNFDLEITPHTTAMAETIQWFREK